jgi:hypothetical protein
MSKTSNEFYIYQEKSSDYAAKSSNWEIKSWKYPYNSDEWQLCRLKAKIYNKKEMEYLEKAQKELLKALGDK